MGQSASWVAPDLRRKSDLKFLADPDRLFTRPECRIIKDQKKIKVGRVALEIDGEMMNVYLKRYNAFSWRYRLGSLFMTSEAYRSWQGAALLSQAGFNVGRPLAAVEHRSLGMLQKSFYLSAEVTDGLTVDAFWDSRCKELAGRELSRFQRSLIQELARLFGSLHRKRIYHKDLKDANILVQEQAGVRRYYFTDLEHVSELKRLSWRRRVKNLVQLNRTLGKRFSRGRRLYFLREYLGESYLDRAERRKWIAKILEESHRADLHSLAKTSRYE